MPRDKDIWDFCVQVVDSLHKEEPQEIRNNLYEEKYKSFSTSKVKE